MRTPFTKMQGLGNDFILVESRESPPSAGKIRALADRHTGIGFDQLLWLAPPRSAGADIYYRIFNTDGSEAEQCGNGARCIAALLARGESREVLLEHAHGRSRAIVNADGSVEVEMNVPDFVPRRIPFLADRELPSYQVEVAGKAVELRVVSMGNPHGVIRVDDVSLAPVDTVGAELERHARFPNRANIGFMQVLDASHVRLRVFERGVGETRACGTGACAAVVVGRRAGWLGEDVRVALPGGELKVRWQGNGSPAWLTGEAVTVFEGTVEL
jgi:diaminopimelate epimerase